MNSNDYKRSLIRIYFELLKKHHENESYPALEEVKKSLEEQLFFYEKELFYTKFLLREIEYFLSHPIPIPPFLSKGILLKLLNEIYEDIKYVLKFIISKAIFVYNNFWVTPIPKKRIPLFTLIFVLTCLLLPFLIIILVRIIRRNIHISILILGIIIFIYLVRKIKNIRDDCEQRITLWEEIIQQNKNEIEALENQIIESQIYNIFDLEDKVKIWLEEDKLDLIELGMSKLNIEKELVDRDPILSFFGISSDESSESFILITDREMEKIKNKYQNLLINEKDFYKEKGLDGKYRYGVYECFLIFLCANFISYYRCYWNFLKGESVDEETCEFLYDSIVSVKTQERSSLNQANPDEKRKYIDLLSLTTMDGKIVYFKISDDRRQKINSSNRRVIEYVSEINEAAARIRYWLRQRRVDYQRIKGVD
ncbi:hypothetical protein SAMD00079811_06620 [Scytonema sp. HK-05]|uniref:hypothetical protein n=1 Tax=Scytonema sp. HK-05 TaxID=1137095 RepID=UPI000936A76A|nr:hypothetical protein [Scytonema sp. HK-05]OKH59842.1 hypothetical protein NIES2130_06650 [Scytonema sp. HK-05]BAY43084.1 hypothetical protein SAMD00079811_06620 [Scytonema sp. HK-05]